MKGCIDEFPIKKEFCSILVFSDLETMKKIAAVSNGTVIPMIGCGKDKDLDLRFPNTFIAFRTVSGCVKTLADKAKM